MAFKIRIEKKSNDFLLCGNSSGFDLKISSQTQIKSYNEQRRNELKHEKELYEDFKNANTEQTVKKAIDNLISIYRLQRRRASILDRIPSKLLKHLVEIRQKQCVAQKNIQEVTEDFRCWNNTFSTELKRNGKDLPEVTLSKLLHSINPERFWIIDRRVKSLMSIWGFDETFSGYGDFLGELYQDRLFSEFQIFIQTLDKSWPFLKSLDKILWTRMS